MSIGDVLALLKTEFPDVTISKIRFLESQGLIVPERTPSGYRKFYEADVARLRWILAQQKEHFLPLKVIKDRLAEGSVPFEGPEPLPGAEDGAPTQGSGAEGAAAAPEGEPVDSESPAQDGHSGEAVDGHDEAPDEGIDEPVQIPSEDVRNTVTEVGTGFAAGTGPVAGTGTAAPMAAAPAGGQVDPAEEESLASRVYSRRELARSSGLSDREVDSLEQYGLIRSHEREGTRYYDYKAKVVADIAARFARYGLEARHLRTYRSSVDREVNLFGQAVSSQLRLRNPEAAAAAAAALDDLCGLAAELRSVLLGWELADLKGS